MTHRTSCFHISHSFNCSQPAFKDITFICQLSVISEASSLNPHLASTHWWSFSGSPHLHTLTVLMIPSSIESGLLFSSIPSVSEMHSRCNKEKDLPKCTKNTRIYCAHINIGQSKCLLVLEQPFSHAMEVLGSFCPPTPPSFVHW